MLRTPRAAALWPWALPAVLLLGACEGAKPGGIYTGTLTSTANGATYTLIGAVTEDGAVQMINTTTPYQYSGQLAISTSKTTGTGSLRFYNGTGDFVTAGSLKGNLGVRTQITGNYTTDTGDAGALALTYSPQYATPQTLAAAAGTYRWVSARNGGTSTLAVDTNGALTGTTEYGCPFTGTLSVTNALYDLYSVTLSPGSDTVCGTLASTTLGGLAYFTPAATTTASATTTGATLTLAATSDAVGYFANYVRQ